jgi:hypothetical protein
LTHPDYAALVDPLSASRKEGKNVSNTLSLKPIAICVE